MSRGRCPKRFWEKQQASPPKKNIIGGISDSNFTVFFYMGVTGYFIPENCEKGNAVLALWSRFLENRKKSNRTFSIHGVTKGPNARKIIGAKNRSFKKPLIGFFPVCSPSRRPLPPPPPPPPPPPLPLLLRDQP